MDPLRTLADDNEHVHKPAATTVASGPASRASVIGTPMPEVVPDTTAVATPPKHSGLKSVASTLLILLAAPLIAWCLVSFVFQSYQVDGQSMETTLQDHDRLIVLKVARTWSRITHHAYMPHRTDVIIFVKRGLYADDQNREKQLIKRVIGLPGDRVVVKDGTLTIYNKDHPTGFQPDKTYPYGKVITATPDTVDITVPPGEIFVCGDNRGNSLDSRIFGTVPVSDIVGKLALRILPLSKAESF